MTGGAQAQPARLRYSAITSLDGYVDDADGRFDWAEPDADVHPFVNDLERPVGTYLYGRRLYEVMRVLAGRARPRARRRARLRPAVAGGRQGRLLARRWTRSRRRARGWSAAFDPDQVRRLVADADRDVSVGGPGWPRTRSRPAWSTSCGVLVTPVVVGGGTAWLPDAVRVDLELVDEHRFGNGVVHLRYRVTR